jgi:hypothetical protein
MLSKPRKELSVEWNFLVPISYRYAVRYRRRMVSILKEIYDYFA